MADIVWRPSTTTSGQRSLGRWNVRLVWDLEWRVPLCRFWHTRGYLSEGRRYLEAVAKSDVIPVTVRAKALDGLGWIAEPQGVYERARSQRESRLPKFQ